MTENNLQNKENINTADTAKKIVELTTNYEADKAKLESTIKEKEGIVVDLAEKLRQSNNRVSTLQKDLEAEQRENRIIREVKLEQKETKQQKSFLEEYERLRNQRNQANIK
jgi:hypothetical protein